MIFDPQSCIQVALNYKHTETHVLFVYDRPDNHSAYKCLAYIWAWLEENCAEFGVRSFQVNQCVVEIPDAGIRTMLKLMFAPADRYYTDDPMF
jgi:hypothetical protein